MLCTRMFDFFGENASEVRVVNCLVELARIAKEKNLNNIPNIQCNNLHFYSRLFFPTHIIFI